MDKETLKKMQKELDKEYATNGLTDDVIDKQIEINKLRNKYDINLDDEIDESGFAQ